MVPCFPLLGLTPSGLFMGLSSTSIYTLELILCSTICVPSATRHNIHMFSHSTVCLPSREPRFEGKQASCYSRSTKVLEPKTKNNRTLKDFSMQQHLLTYPTYNYITVFYLISVFLHTVLHFIKNDSLLRILRFPGYFETPLFRTFSISFGTSK